MRGSRTWAVAVLVSAVLLSRIGPAHASDDPLWPQQWNLVQAGAPAAWAASSGDGVRIGIVDTGVELSHPDLVGKIDATAECRGGCRDGGGDDHGHGTHVSGIAAAATDNGVGIAGVAPGARLVVAKALDSSGRGRVADVADGIDWVVARGAKVVNLSLGENPDLLGALLPGVVGGPSPLLQAVQRAWTAGSVPVLASGNDPSRSADYGNLDVVVVGATTPGGDVAPYSGPTGNAKWALVAPGGAGNGRAEDNVLSTWRGGAYRTSAGTSMAAPHVSAGLALLLAQGRSPAEAVDRLLGTADPLSCACAGRLNLARAVGGSAPSPTTSSTAPAGQTPPPPATSPEPGPPAAAAAPPPPQPAIPPSPQPAPPAPQPAPQSSQPAIPPAPQAAPPAPQPAPPPPAPSVPLPPPSPPPPPAPPPPAERVATPTPALATPALPVAPVIPPQPVSAPTGLPRSPEPPLASRPTPPTVAAPATGEASSPPAPEDRPGGPPAPAPPPEAERAAGPVGDGDTLVPDLPAPGRVRVAYGLLGLTALAVPLGLAWRTRARWLAGRRLPGPPGAA